MSRLLVIGAGGHGVVVADAAEMSQAWSGIVFADDAYPHTTSAADWEIIGRSSSLREFKSDVDAAIVGLGNNLDRLSLSTSVERANIPLATVIHPRAVVSRFSRCGGGTVLLANSVVNARSVIGKACIINTAATVDHDCRLADGVHVAPGATLAADVVVEERAWIGAGATVREQVTIGRDAIVGAGAVVIRDVADRMIVAGVPARPIRHGPKAHTMQGFPRQDRTK